MNTVYDWVTVLIFAALVTRFLQQSAKAADEQETVWHYLIASVGCACANWLGNNGWNLAAVVLLAGTVTFMFHCVAARGPKHP